MRTTRNRTAAMSNKKRGISYIKNEEPAFLKRMKEQAGFKEGPTVDTKRERLEERADDDSDTEKDDEKPQVLRSSMLS